MKIQKFVASFGQKQILQHCGGFADWRNWVNNASLKAPSSSLSVTQSLLFTSQLTTNQPRHQFCTHDVQL